MKLPKKFTFAIVAMLVTGWVTFTLKYDADSYLKALLVICGIFTAGQTIADTKKKDGV